MSCAQTKAELVGFHFGEVSDDVRGQVEAHLTSCGACLAEYLALKRSLETQADEPAPSAESRRALRGAMAQALGLADAPWRWWQRPLALGFATASVALAIFTVQALERREVAAPVGLERIRGAP